jgi:hypothetical protein
MRTRRAHDDAVQREAAASTPHGDKASRPAVSCVERQGAALMEQVDASPRQRTQRRAMQACFGPPVQREREAEAAGEWAQDVVVTWGNSEGKPVTIRVLARAFHNHFPPAWQNKIMAGVESMWDDIKVKRDDGSLRDLYWGQYLVKGKSTDIRYTVAYDRRYDEVVISHANAIQEGKDYPAQLQRDE